MKLYKGLHLELLQHLMYMDVQKYARSTGWERVPNIKGDIAVYRRPEKTKCEIIVPMDTEFSDYSLRMAELITLLSEIEERSSQEILNDLLLPESDVLRFRLETRETETGIIPLDVGLGLINGGRKGLMAAACSAIQPQSFHPRLSRTEAEEFINQCKMGQTEYGSYTVTLICPMNIKISEMTNGQTQIDEFYKDMPDPFARNVTKTFMKSVGHIVESIKSELTDQLIKPVGDQIVISSNLCEALQQLQPQDERSSLHISCTWSRTTQPPTDVPSRVKVPKEYFPTIDAIGQHLRPKKEPKHDYFIGKVTELRGEPDKDEKMQGEIIFTSAVHTVCMHDTASQR